MDRAPFVALVCERGGLEEAAAERVITATLAALSERLLSIDAQAIAARLPKAWTPLLARGHGQEFTVDGFYTRVANAAGLGRVEALEQTQVVCQVLTEALDDTGRQHLVLHLDDEWRRLFVPRNATPPEFGLRGANRRHVAPGAGNTLASGRPGGHHPLSEGSPAQPGSVVASADPHADTKLSSAQGMSAEREGQTLASGRPGGTRPVSDASD
jgi:uncharacterized protein (DUF2267 family)